MRSGKLTIATCQHPVGADIKANFAAVVKLVRSAKLQKADIAHFSECNLTGYAGLDFKEINRNDIPVINDKGEIQDRYDKRLLAGTGVEMEHLHYAPGRRPVVFNIHGVNCGLLICHEWRYPELYREYKRLKVNVLFQSWYDGNLSPSKYRSEGKELGDLITGTVRGNAANNYLWISGSNTCKRESCFPCFMVRPDGKVPGRLSRNRAGILISYIDLEESFADPSGHLRESLNC